MRIVPNTALPSPDVLLRHAKGLAMLDAILCPEWEYRYFSFNRRWSPGEQMASMRDGSGSHYVVLFVDGGGVLKTYDRHVAASFDVEGFVAALTEVLPPPYRDFPSEPAFVLNEVTQVTWFDASSGRWSTALPSDDGPEDPGEEMLALLASGDAAAYRAWAEEYFETAMPLEAVEAVLRLEPLTGARVARLNDAVTLEDLEEDLGEIGFPVADE